MAAIDDLEVKLNEVFGKKAPQLPKAGKEWLVRWAPILTLIIGILSVFSVFSLWRAAHTVSYADLANDLCRAYASSGCDVIPTNRLSLWFWIALAVLVVEAVLYILAYTPLTAKKKQGWNYLFWAALINVVYAIVSLFMTYAGVGSFIGALIGTALSFWLIFQIREYYVGKKIAPAKTDT